MNDISALIIGYTVIILLILLVVFIILVNHNVILKKDSWIRRFFTNPLTYYSLKRIGSSLISVILAVAITFVLLRTNKNYHAIFCSAWGRLPPETENIICNAYLARLGLMDSYNVTHILEDGTQSVETIYVDVPMFTQLLKYYYNIFPIPKLVCLRQNLDNVTGEWSCLEESWTLLDFGTSATFRKGIAITKIVGDTMPISFKWSIWSIILETILGYPLGLFMAKYKDRLVDKIGKAYIIFVDSIPGLVYYYMFLIFFSSVLHWKTIYEPNDPMTLLPPIITSAFGGMAGIAYWVRRYMLNEFSSDYVKFARSKGLSENKILFTHILRNAIVPLSRSFFTSIIACLVGSFFIENIYSIGGFGGILIKALNANDFMLVQGLVVITAIISVLSYLVSDISMAIADPRISFTEE